MGGSCRLMFKRLLLCPWRKGFLFGNQQALYVHRSQRCEKRKQKFPWWVTGRVMPTSTRGTWTHAVHLLRAEYHIMIADVEYMFHPGERCPIFARLSPPTCCLRCAFLKSYSIILLAQQSSEFALTLLCLLLCLLCCKVDSWVLYDGMQDPTQETNQTLCKSLDSDVG